MPDGGLQRGGRFRIRGFATLVPSPPAGHMPPSRLGPRSCRYGLPARVRRVTGSVRTTGTSQPHPSPDTFRPRPPMNRLAPAHARRLSLVALVFAGGWSLIATARAAEPRRL